MIISNIINDSFGLLSKQLRFYCWHFRRDLDQRQRQELIDLLYEQHFERLSNKIKVLIQSNIADCKQQIGKLLFDQCLKRNRRHQLIQLIESALVDIDVRLDNYGRTLLHRSAYNLDYKLVKILIDQGVNIRLRDYAGNTALHIAIQSYRNGAVIYGDGPDVAQNLTFIITLLLNADMKLQSDRYKRKKLKLSLNTGENTFSKLSHSKMQFKREKDLIGNAYLDHSTPDSAKKVLAYSLTSPKGPHPKLIRQLIDQKTTIYQSLDDPQCQNFCRNSQEYLKQSCKPVKSTETINPILMEDNSVPLVDTKNAFGRTALHYCTLVIGEQHLAHFVKLLISFGADVDATDTRMKTPLYCLVKRPCTMATRQKYLAITHLLENGCDDLGLAVEPKLHFTDEFIRNLEENPSNIVQTNYENTVEPIFINSSYKRVPSLKHLVRVRLIKLQDEKLKLRRQTKLSLPNPSPASLTTYMNRRILHQTELY